MDILNSKSLIWRCWNTLLSLILMLFLPAVAFGANDLRVLVVLSESIAPYQTFAKAFQQNLTENFHVSVVERAEDFSSSKQQVDLILTVGGKAADWVIERATTPVLAVMLPSIRFAELSGKQTRPKQFSAIYIDQPWVRQVGLLHAALPESKNIGLLYSAETHLNIQALNNELTRHGDKLVAKQIQDAGTLFADLEDVLARSDVLLAIPDSRIYSSNNIRNILMSSYRQRVPLVGLSQAYVNAGALCAIFSTPEQFAAQASIMTISFEKTQHLPEPQQPTLFTIAVNQEVARSLGVTTKSTELLHLQIEKAGGIP